jgi:hypothetical protein
VHVDDHVALLPSAQHRQRHFQLDLQTIDSRFSACAIATVQRGATGGGAKSGIELLERVKT